MTSPCYVCGEPFRSDNGTTWRCGCARGSRFANRENSTAPVSVADDIADVLEKALGPPVFVGPKMHTPAERRRFTAPSAQEVDDAFGMLAAKDASKRERDRALDVVQRGHDALVDTIEEQAHRIDMLERRREELIVDVNNLRASYEGASASRVVVLRGMDHDKAHAYVREATRTIIAMVEARRVRHHEVTRRRGIDRDDRAEAESRYEECCAIVDEIEAMVARWEKP